MCEKADEGVNVRAYEYENAIHVTLPGLNQSSVEFVGMRKANRPYMRRAIYGRVVLHYCNGYRVGGIRQDYQEEDYDYETNTCAAWDLFLWTGIRRHVNEAGGWAPIKSEGGGSGLGSVINT